MSERKRWRAPFEVKLAAGLLVGAPTLWVLLVLFLVLAANASGRTFLFPVTALVLGGLVALGLGLKMPSARIAGYVVVVLFALVHAVGLLSAELWWIKVFSGLAFAAYGYSAVLLSSMPVRRHLLGAAA